MKFRMVSDQVPSLFAFLQSVRVDAREKAKALQEERVRCKALEDELARTMESHVMAARHLEELSREKSRLEDLHNVAQTKIGNLETSRLELDQRLRGADRNVDSLQSGMSCFLVKTELHCDTMTDIKRLATDLGSAQQQVHSSRAHSTKVEQELSAARGQIEELRASAIEDSERWQEQDQSRQQTISFLVSEKASLIASVQRLEEAEIGIATFDIVWTLLKSPFLELQEKGKSFLAEQAKAVGATKKVQELEVIAARQGSELEKTLSREKELLERVRDQVCVVLYFSRQDGLHVPVCRNAKSNSGKPSSRKYKLLPINISNGSANWRSRLRVMIEQTNWRSL